MCIYGLLVLTIKNRGLSLDSSVKVIKKILTPDSLLEIIIARHCFYYSLIIEKVKKPPVGSYLHCSFCINDYLPPDCFIYSLPGPLEKSITKF